MQSYTPKISVLLIKTARRANLALGRPAAQRFRDLEAIDLTPYLPKDEPVTVQHSIAGTGTWSCQLADQLVKGMNESLYGLIEVNDMVEIRMAREPVRYGGKLPVVMRGFVSSIDRVRSMAGGTPHRRIHLAGHDYSKVLDILRIYYLNNSAVGDNVLGSMSFFHKYVSLDNAKIMSAQEFVQLVMDEVINKFVDGLTVDAKGNSVGTAPVRKLRAVVNIEGTVSPLSVSTFTDGSAREFLSRFLDIGAFNEMFVEDREDESLLVIRPNHFLDLNDAPIQPMADLDSLDSSTVVISDGDDIEQLTEGRTDAHVANYFWVTNDAWMVREAVEVRQLAAASSPEQYALFDYVNTSAARFGFRKMEVASAMGPPGLNHGDALSQSAIAGETDRLMAWLAERRRILAEQNRDNSILESGQIVMKGYERVRRGIYLLATFGSLHVRYYAANVTHLFAPMGAYRTIVDFERGTNFATRAQLAEGQYLTELNLTGSRKTK